MTDDTAPSQSIVQDHFEGRMSRAGMLKAAAAAGLAAVSLPAAARAEGSTGGSGSLSFPYFPQVASGSYTPESINDIVSNILTWAYFEVAAATAILATPALSNVLGVSSGLPRAFLQAFAVELQAHLDFWNSIVPGAAPRTTTYTIDPALVPNAVAGLAIFEALASVRAALMITAVREFAELGQPTLAKYAAQTEGMYAEERAIARVFQALNGNAAAVPPNNKAFETDLFLYTRDAVNVLVGLGLIGGSGLTIP